MRICNFFQSAQAFDVLLKILPPCSRACARIAICNFNDNCFYTLLFHS